MKFPAFEHWSCSVIFAKGLFIETFFLIFDIQKEVRFLSWVKDCFPVMFKKKTRHILTLGGTDVEGGGGGGLRFF